MGGCPAMPNGFLLNAFTNISQTNPHVVQTCCNRNTPIVINTPKRSQAHTDNTKRNIKIQPASALPNWTRFPSTNADIRHKHKLTVFAHQPEMQHPMV